MICWRVPCGGYVYVPDATELRYLPPHAAQAARLFMEGRSRELLTMSDPLARSWPDRWADG